MGGEPEERVEVLWQRLSGSLARYFRRRTKSEDDVEDLVQETFLRVQSRLAELEDVDRTAAWIQRIARNVWIDAQRRERRPADVNVDELAEEDDVDLTGTVAGWLTGTIEELEPAYAEVLRRSELEGELHREIADDLGLSVSAVKSRVQRGRAQIRKNLEDCCRFEFDRRGGVVGYQRRSEDDCGC